MSYVIHIWQTPIPTSVLQADKICDRLQDKEGRQNPRFIELAKRLSQRYPCRSQMTGDEDDEEGVWLDEPLDGISPNPVLALGIRSDYVMEVMPFVAETANALGLTVYDTQLGECYLPSGQVLTMPGQQPMDLAHAVDPELIYSGEQIIKIAAEHSTEFYKKYGYKYSRKGNCFVKKHDGFYHRAEFRGGAKQISVTHSICITKGLHLVSHIGYIKYIKPECACTILISENQENYVNAWPKVNNPYRRDSCSISVNSVSDVKSGMNKIMLYEEQTFIPLWMQIKTLEDVHAFLNTPAFEPLWNLLNGNQFAQLLVAHLVKVENLDSLIVKVRKSLPNNAGEQWIHPLFEKTAALILLEFRTGSM
jgi:hypothetical protein